MAYPTLRQNEVISALYNQIISINTESKNIAGVYGKLLEAMKVDGGMYGDTLLKIETDALESYDFLADTSDQCNVLALHRPPEPNTQAFVVDTFRQIAVTLDDYMSKRAFSDEGSFGQFNGVVRGWVGDTKKVHDATTFNAFVGTAKSAEVAENISIDFDDYTSVGQGLGEVIANLLIELGDVSRDYNDLGFLRSYDENDIIICWNSNYVNHIKKVDMPALFNKEGLVDKLDSYVLPARYFGDVNTSAITAANNAGTMRSLIEKDYTVSGATKHVFAGDLIPAGVAIAANESYTPNAKVICKVMCNGSVPFCSSFSVGTSFVNPKNLSENQYLTWSYNTLAYRKGLPYITIKEEE